MSRASLLAILVVTVAITPAGAQESAAPQQPQPLQTAPQAELRPGAPSPAAPQASVPTEAAGTAAIGTRALNPQETCNRVLIPQGVRETIQANVNLATRIQFPGTVGAYQIATPGLWDGSYHEDSVWIRPKTVTAAADKTTATIYLQDGRRYDFMIEAVPEVPNTCVIVGDAVAASGQLVAPRTIHRQTTSRGVSTNDALDDQRHKYEYLMGEMRRQVESQANDRIKAFEYAVNTRYSWAGDSPADKNLITAVYDDGRFTYLRIATSAFGLPALSGTLNEKDVVLQYQYDDLTGVFTILGLYDKVRIRLGTHKIDVNREG